MTDFRHTIVLTGAPASGKTELFESLKLEPRLSRFIFYDELARALIASDPTYRDRWHQLHLDIYAQQVAREDQAGNRSFISDRGTVDAFAFHPETAAAVNTTIEREYRRYGLVIQLGSTARLGEQYYKTDQVRNEPIAQTLKIEAAIKAVWQAHPNYYFVEAETDIEVKRKKVVALVARYMEFEKVE